MKKIKTALCFFLALLLATALVGCSFINSSTENDSVPQQNEVRYTVTEEEWDSWVTYHNYTIEQYSDGYHLVHKYTENAFTVGDRIIVIDGDKEYQLEVTDDGYVAFDCTDYYDHEGLLSGGYVYDEFIYDADICAYVLDVMDDMGARWEVKFENGIPVSIIYTEVKVVDGVETTTVITSLYTNVGTTVIDVPEYVIEEEQEIRKTVTEEEWNSNINAGNFSGNFSAIIDIINYEFYYCFFKYTGNALVLDGNIIVFEGDKKYKLEEVDGTWYASEWNEYEICSTLIPSNLDFDDFEYSEIDEAYKQKVETFVDLYYLVGFAEGKLSYISVQKSYDIEDPGYFDIFSFNIYEIGTTEIIEVPEYVIID